MSATNPKAAIIGGGVIGGGWAARFLLHGWDVAVFDPSPAAIERVHQVIERARIALKDLYDSDVPIEGLLTMCSTLEEAVANASWIQESTPERLDVKLTCIADIEAVAEDPSTIIGSSTSGFRPSQLKEHAASPDRIIVAHPFNPVYLIPLVELVGETETIERAKPLLEAVGMKPLHVRKEIDAHIADRLLEAVWREALWLVHDDVATTQEIDDAISFGFGLRWAQMGLFETYRIAGGDSGMAHFLAQFGPALKWPWTKLMDVPEMDDALVGKIAAQSDAQSGDNSIAELEKIRDRNLVAIQKALAENDHGAGRLLNERGKSPAS